MLMLPIISHIITCETCEINIGAPHFSDIQQIDECNEQICTGLYSALPALWIRIAKRTIIHDQKI